MSFDRTTTSNNSEKLGQLKTRLKELLHLINTSLATPDEAVKVDASYKFFLSLKQLEDGFLKKYVDLVKQDEQIKKTQDTQFNFDINFRIFYEELETHLTRAYAERVNLVTRMLAIASEPTPDISSAKPEEELNEKVQDKITHPNKKNLVKLQNKFTTLLNNVTALLLVLRDIKEKDIPIATSIRELEELKKDTAEILASLQKNENDDPNTNYIEEAKKILHLQKKEYERIQDKHKRIFFDQETLDEYNNHFARLEIYEKEFENFTFLLTRDPQQLNHLGDILAALKNFSPVAFVAKQIQIEMAEKLINNLREVDYAKLGDKYLEVKNSSDNNFRELKELHQTIDDFYSDCEKFKLEYGERLRLLELIPEVLPSQKVKKSTTMPEQLPTPKVKESTTAKKPGFFATHWQTLIAASITSILTGAATGALVGTLIGGPIGAVVGIVVGVVTAVGTGAYIAYDGAKKDLALQEAKEKASMEQAAPASSSKLNTKNILSKGPQITSPLSIPTTSIPTMQSFHGGSSPTLAQQGSYAGASPTLFAKSYGRDKSAFLSSAAKKTHSNSV